MFALLALVAFLLALFGASIGALNLITLGLASVAAHLLVGPWPWGPPVRARQ